MNNEATFSPIDLSQSRPIKSTSSPRGILSISVVNTNSNGKRIKLSKKLLAALGNPDKIQIRTIGNEVILGQCLNKDDIYYNLSQSSLGTIYSSSLVEEITSIFKLSFEDKTSLTLNNISIQEALFDNEETVTVAVISE